MTYLISLDLLCLLNVIYCKLVVYRKKGWCCKIIFYEIQSIGGFGGFGGFFTVEY